MTSSSLNHCRAFADELEALRRGELSIDTLWRRHAGTTEGDCEEVLSFVQHWVADADIRATDPEYHAMQESEFDRLLSLLRAGRMTEAKTVTFLGR